MKEFVSKNYSYGKAIYLDNVNLKIEKLTKQKFPYIVFFLFKLLEAFNTFFRLCRLM